MPGPALIPLAGYPVLPGNQWIPGSSPGMTVKEKAREQPA